MNFQTLDEILEFSKEKGSLYFSEENLKKYGTRFSQVIYPNGVFVLSEVEDGVRKCGVRIVKQDGNIHSLTGLVFDTFGEAHATARKIVRGMRKSTPK